MHSNLVNGVYIAHSGNYQKGRSGYKICKITPHQMAGKLTGKQCAVNIFGKAGRKASANYCIGYAGDIVCNVEEENRAYTSSSKWNDCQAITIEVSNSANGTSNITEASWNSLVNLCEDICRRHDFRLTYDGTKNGSLTRHNMYANTNCPGAYLQSRLPELARIVNERLDDVEKPKEEDFEMAKIYKNGSTSEPVYADTTLTLKTGSLDPNEICDCLAIVDGRYLVKYKVNGKNAFKTGFVKYSGGVK